MENLICTQCGGALTVSEDGKNGNCPYCGSTFRIGDDKSQTLIVTLNRATQYRLRNDFENALIEYECAIKLSPSDCDCYMGALLSKYGIEFVVDERSGNQIPTCHRAIKQSIFEDELYKKMILYAPADRVFGLKDLASRIDELQRAIWEKIEREKDYDVFISFKAKDSEGKFTEDRAIARKIYDELSERGLKTFFSEITLKDKLGEGYEPSIYKALFSSRVMILVGTKGEYVNSPWVKNEWSRFRDRAKDENLSDCAIAVFKGDSLNEFPPFFKGQGIDINNYPLGGYEIDIADALARKFSDAMDEVFIKKAFDELSESNFEKAEEYLAKALAENPRHAKAYVGRVMVEHDVPFVYELATICGGFDDDKNFQRALRYASPSYRRMLEDLNDKAKSLKLEEETTFDEDEFGTINDSKSAETEETTEPFSEFTQKINSFTKKTVDRAVNFTGKIVSTVNKTVSDVVKSKEESKKELRAEKIQTLLKVADTAFFDGKNKTHVKVSINGEDTDKCSEIYLGIAKLAVSDESADNKALIEQCKDKAKMCEASQKIISIIDTIFLIFMIAAAICVGGFFPFSLYYICLFLVFMWAIVTPSVNSICARREKVKRNAKFK